MCGFEDKIDVVLPTGAMGNMTGGYMAKQMGIPIGRLCAGVNINGTKCFNETCHSRCELVDVIIYMY